jgi:mannose-6-phosphate isomerase
MAELYPLKFNPYFKELIWGGRKLERLLHKRLPPGKAIGESWEVCDTNIIQNGPLAGLTLADVTRRFGQKLVGINGTQSSTFPLLLKLSSTELDLSIQVHPDDAGARSLEPDSGFSGKAEMIYVLDRESKARVFYGFKEQISRDVLQSALANGSAIVDLLQEIVVEPGDVIFVPPGVVHGYGAGLVYFELQQATDITYRLYDWSRVDSAGRQRDLHIAKAMEVIDYQAVNPRKIEPVCIREDYGQHYFLAACRHFLVERLDLSANLLVGHTGGSFHLLCVVGGTAVLHWQCDSKSDLQIETGDVVLLPASLYEYILAPDSDCQILRSSVPDLEHDVVDYLLKHGVSALAIFDLGGSITTRNDLATLLLKDH